jgi:hypothetical protein
LYTFVLVLVARWFGIDLDEGDATEIITSSITLISFILLIWGQLARKDLMFGLFRKE